MSRSHPKYDGTDSETRFQDVKQVITAKISNVDSKENLYKAIKSFKENYGEPDTESIRVILNTGGGKIKSIVSLTDIAHDDAKDVLYTRSVEISDFSSELPSCFDSANHEVCDKIKASLVDPNLWS